jgi:hypothetical protein
MKLRGAAEDAMVERLDHTEQDALIDLLKRMLVQVESGS